MSDHTVPQFGRSLRERTQPLPAAGAPRSTVCPACGSRFSPDGRFCPFDGSALVPAAGWGPGAQALLGSVVDGRYEVLSVIGEGGMGTVYEVRHQALGKRFALKALRKELALDGEIASRFIQEARTAAAVSHPGLVEITDFGRLESGQVYFVMELLEGQSLASLISSGGPIPAARGLSIVRQLAHALKAAHDASIVHRDLKPDNIHLSRGDAEPDCVKIVDFGLARVIGSSRLTRAGMVFGTPHYMSPEQAAGDSVDHRADIYALGIVMYEMFTGKVPFEADSYMGVLTKHMYVAPVPPSEHAPELKALGVVEEVILRCLQKRPAARYENLALFLADLDRRLPTGGKGARATDVAYPSVLADQLELPTPEEALPRSGLRRGAVLGATAAAVSVGALIALLLRDGGSGEKQTRAAALPEASKPPTSRTPSATVASSGERPLVASARAVASAPSLSRSAGNPTHRPVGKPNRPDPRPLVAPAPRTPSSGPKRPAGPTEIVDPWAR